jgi:ABC-type transport system involved in Fe-S cluster assembly fused permease/ATPase subunit
MRKSVLSADINVTSLVITLKIQQIYAVVIKFCTYKYLIFSVLVSEARFRKLGVQFET